jgi:uncharacterized protein
VSQFEYWQQTQLVIDVIPGRGGTYTTECPTGKRFLTRSRLFMDDETEVLMANPPQRTSVIESVEGLRTIN